MSADATTPTEPRTIDHAGTAPDEPIVVVDPPDWGTDTAERLERFARAGATVVVCGEIRGEAWADLVGVDPAGAATPSTELVVDATPHPAARNLGDPLTVVGRSVPVAPDPTRPRC